MHIHEPPGVDQTEQDEQEDRQNQREFDECLTAATCSSAAPYADHGDTDFVMVVEPAELVTVRSTV